MRASLAATRFEELCMGLCGLLGLRMPALSVDEQGAASLEVELDGVALELAHDPARKPHAASLAIRFGPLPRGRELAACRALMNINTQVLVSGSAFCRDPATGDVILRQQASLRDADAMELYDRIEQIVASVHGWREHHFLAPSIPCPDGGVPLGG